MTEIVRADTLRGFREFVAELGGDADALLREAGLDPAALEDGDSYISLRAVGAVMERAAKTLDCPDFGLRFAKARSGDALGPLAVAMQNAPTTRETIAVAVRFQHFHNPSLMIRLEPMPDPACEFLALEHHLRRAPKTIQMSERLLAFAARFIALVSGAPPKEVWFYHRRLAPLAAYRDALEALPCFSMPKQGLVLESAVLDAHRPQANPQLKRIAEHFLENAAPVQTQSAAARARAVVDRMMRSGDCTQADLAQALSLHERTLQRRLKTENTSFEAIKDDVRREIAHEMLAQRDVKLSHIAEMLGYAETSAFTRSCRRWFGAPPRALRKMWLAEQEAI